VNIILRPAAVEDIKGIMQVEQEGWGDKVGTEAMASEETMLSRILLCNSTSPAWFWVVEKNGRIVGHAITQPTSIAPGSCTSWDQATDQGRLVGTFDLEGHYVYGVTIAAANKAPQWTADLLVLAAHKVRQATGRKVLYLCARMSGYGEAKLATGISPEKYWSQTRADGSPSDPFLHLFWNLIGVRPVKLLLNGFPPDPDSDGHGVLCVSEDPEGDIRRSEERLKEAGYTGKGVVL
jgi:hypothetical protein